MKTIKEIIKEIDSWNGTDERIGCTRLCWGEVKLLIETIRGLTPCNGDVGCDGNCQENCNFRNDVKLAKKLDNEIDSLNNGRTVDKLIEDYAQTAWDSSSNAACITWGEFMNVLMEVMKLRNELSVNQDNISGLDEDLSEQFETPIGIISQRIRKVTEGKKPESLEHCRNETDGDCGCAECEITRLELYNKRGYNDSSWAERQILELLEGIKHNTRHRPSL